MSATQWVRLAAGAYQHPLFGKVWREGRQWNFQPHGGITRYPYDSMRHAQHVAEREYNGERPRRKGALTLLAEAYNTCMYGHEILVTEDWLNAARQVLLEHGYTAEPGSGDMRKNIVAAKAAT